MPIEQAAGVGLASLFQLGSTVTVLLLVILGGYVVVKNTINSIVEQFKDALLQCQKREERALMQWEKATEKIADVVQGNSEVVSGVKIALAKIEARLEK